jgi:hypothetical protein
MVQYEPFNVGERLFNRAYSDKGVKIHGGVPEDDYDESCDPAEFERTFTETDIPVDPDETEAEEILNILMGVEE